MISGCGRECADKVMKQRINDEKGPGLLREQESGSSVQLATGIGPVTSALPMRRSTD